MGFDSPGFIMDGTTCDAELFRRSIGTLLSPAGGIVTPGDLAVAQQTVPNMSVQIGVGQVWVPGTSTATQGPYYSRNGAAITQAINAASVSNPRVDIVGVQVQDATYAGGAHSIAPFYVAGTPTAGATLANLAGIGGAVPASSLVLAYVLVPTSATSIVTADIANVAGVAGRATGAWTVLTLPTGIVMGSSLGNGAPYVPSLRLEGDVVRFKGAIENTSGSTWLKTTALLTVPSAFRPASTAYSQIGGPLTGSTYEWTLSVDAGGNLRTWTDLLNFAVVPLDGLTYTLS